METNGTNGTVPTTEAPARSGSGGWNKGIKGSTKKGAGAKPQSPVAALAWLSEELGALDTRRAEVVAEIAALRPALEKLLKAAGIST